MKHIIPLFILILCVSFTLSADAQLFYRVPKNYSFDAPDSYPKYDNDIIKCVNWLEKKHPDQNAQEYSNASRFLMEYVTGCPYVHFQDNVRVSSVFSDIPELKIYYVGGWARYALQNKHSDGRIDKVQCAIAGIKCALNVYKHAYASKSPSKNIENLMKEDNAGTLEQWVGHRM